MTNPLPTSYVTVAEIARVLRVSKMTVYRLVHSGELKSLQVGRSFRVHRSDLHDYLNKAVRDVTSQAS